jgi:Fe-S-cluster containining protein
MHLPKLKREQVPKGECLCDHCTAKCCRYFALPIEHPTEHADWEFCRWFLLHEKASLFKDGDHWYLLVHTACKHLQSDNRCGIYETRPQVCRDYSTDECEYEDDCLYDQYLETAEQVDEYATALFPRPKGKSLRSREPALLPLL